MPARAHEKQLHQLYCSVNRREFVHPDPLEFLYHFDQVRDREIVGLIASSLAYGNVRQILRSVASVLERFPSPYAFLADATPGSLYRSFRDFKHRFTTGEELATLLYAVKKVIEGYGSLNACFAAGLGPRDETIIPALSKFVQELSAVFPFRPPSLLPSPDAGSACKRLNLFLRWMVRKDQVDPGGWVGVPASKLVVPVDTHMHRISLRLGLTKRKQADLRTALEITAAFKAIEPDDPVKFDFCLTRLGIQKPVPSACDSFLVPY
jgi:uncharacterized protein (TIGR02757 family)